MKITILVFALSMSVGCAARVATAPESETIGSLSQGPSVYTAPLKHDAPPEMGGVAGTDDDNAQSDTSLDVLRREAAQAGDVNVTKKSDGVSFGTVRQ